MGASCLMKETIILFTGNWITDNRFRNRGFYFSVWSLHFWQSVASFSWLPLQSWVNCTQALEALEQLLFKRFVYEEDPTIPDRFHDLASTNKKNLESLLHAESIVFTPTYQRYRSRIQNGTAQKTAQIWKI